MDKTYSTKKTECRYLMEHNINKSQITCMAFLNSSDVVQSITNIIHPQSIHESNYFVSANIK